MAPLTSLLVLGLSTISAVLGAPASRSGGRTLYAPTDINSKWQHVGSSVSSTPLEFTFILQGKDYSGLTAKMEEIALARTEWLTQEQLAEYVGPVDGAVDAVHAAIQSFGGVVSSASVTGDQITVTTTVGAASKFFNAQFHEYNLQGQGTAHRTHAYTIPSELAEFVADVHPIASFQTIRSFAHVASPEERDAHLANLETRATPSGCSTSETTSACYRALYQYSSYTPTVSSTSVGIIAYIGQAYSSKDLGTWISSFATYAKGYSIAVNTSNGATNNQNSPGVEAALDTQTIAGIVYPISSTFYDIGTSSTPGDLFLITFQNFINAKTRPSVISISYGSDESDQTSAQATSMCNAAQQLSALGTTIVASSGDSGTDGQGDVSCPPFAPTYPGGCPYILSAGATQAFSPEVMVSPSIAGFYSGAGFSKYFTTPSYQTTQVAAYEKVSGNTGDYNTKGRGFPDIAAQGSLQPVVVSGSTELVGGTSCSAPIISGGLTLLNNLLVAAGKPTTGYLHPTLYANPSAFTDITSGGSYCSTSSKTGLPATTGWDAPSGLGSPLFTSLRAVYGV